MGWRKFNNGCSGRYSGALQRGSRTRRLRSKPEPVTLPMDLPSWRTFLIRRHCI